MNQFTKTHFSAKSIAAINALLKSDKPIDAQEMPKYRARIRSAILNTVKEEGTFTLPLPFYNGDVEVTFNLIGATLYWQVKGKELFSADLPSIEEWMDYMGIAAVGTLGIWLGITHKENKVSPGLRSIYTHPSNTWAYEYKVIYVEGDEVAHIMESLSMTFDEVMLAISSTYFEPSTTVRIIVNSNSVKNTNHDTILEPVRFEKLTPLKPKGIGYSLSETPVFLDYTNLNVTIDKIDVVQVEGAVWNKSWIVIGAVVDTDMVKGLTQIMDAMKNGTSRIYQAHSGRLVPVDTKKLAEAVRLYSRTID